MSTPRRPLRVARLLLAGLLTTAGLTTVGATPAQAAGEQVTAWLTTTNDSGGRQRRRGVCRQQTPFAFQAGSGGSGENITVDENTRYQPFAGGGASFTDTAAWLMNGSGALTQATRDATMQKLFDPDRRHRPLASSATRWAPPTWPASATPTTTCRPGRPTRTSPTSPSPTTSPTCCR